MNASTRGKGVAVVLAIAAAATACSALVSFSGTQCATNDDCAARGGSVPLVCTSGVCVAAPVDANVPDAEVDAGPQDDGGPFGCIGMSESHADAAVPSTLTIIPIDGLSSLTPERSSYTVREGVSIRLCAKRDPDCATPLVGATLTTDAGITVPTPSILDFYVEASGANIMPSIQFPVTSADDPRRLNRTIFVGTLLATQAGTLAAFVDTNVDPKLAIVLGRPIDCSLEPNNAAGIGFTLTPTLPQTVGFYTQKGLPSKSANATDGDGLGGYVNAPVGQITLQTHFPNQSPIGEASGFTRAGWMTIFEVAPSMGQ